MSSELSLDTVRGWLRTLRALTAERGLGETEIEQRYRADLDTTRGELTSTTEQIERKYRIDSTTSKAQYRATEKRLTTTFKNEDDRIRRAEIVERESITEKGQHSESAAHRRWDEAVWAAETVFEAKEDHPKQAFKQTGKSLDTVEKNMQSIEQAAIELLQRCRISIGTPGNDAESGPTRKSLMTRI